jgi:CRISPR system Cascade subunit CasE
MYLTQLRLDPRNAPARRDLADPYDMHRTLVRAFAPDERTAPSRFLWRLEPGASWQRATVLVQSASPGDWSFLKSVSGYLLDDRNEALAVKTFDPAAWAQAGASLRFRLAANPTVTRQGKRLGLVGEEAQVEWLHRQGERLGFDLQAALVTGSEVLRGRKGSMQVSLLRVQYDGMLQVRDADLLCAAIASGIGHGKAFGCGMLSLARRSGS